jgi:hypothetical protein
LGVFVESLGKRKSGSIGNVCSDEGELGQINELGRKIHRDKGRYACL